MAWTRGSRRAVSLACLGIGLTGMLAGCNSAATPQSQQTSLRQPRISRTFLRSASKTVTATETTRSRLHYGQISRVTAAQLGKSWHAGCPTPPSDLRRLVVRYWGFDGRQHLGRLVVNVDAISPIRTAMATLDHDHFPIRSMIPISYFGGKDNRSMRADNTSAFNCRYAKANGVKHWSEHAFGEAIDVNPLRNPYVFDGTVIPKSGTTFADRQRYRPGMILAGSKAQEAFTAVGWGWGGRWTAPDYQHFSATGT